MILHFNGDQEKCISCFHGEYLMSLIYCVSYLIWAGQFEALHAWDGWSCTWRSPFLHVLFADLMMMVAMSMSGDLPLSIMRPMGGKLSPHKTLTYLWTDLLLPQNFCFSKNNNGASNIVGWYPLINKIFAPQRTIMGSATLSDDTH